MELEVPGEEVQPAAVEGVPEKAKEEGQAAAEKKKKKRGWVCK